MNPIRVWNSFWFQPISARPLGLFRVLMGLIVLAHLALLSADLDYWLTDHGMLQGNESRLIAGPLRFSALNWVQDPTSVHVFFAGTVVIASLFTLGWHTRVVSVLLYLAILSIHHRMVPTNCGPDNLLLLLIFYLMLAPSGAAFSLDARREARRRGTLAEPIIAPWAQRLIQLHLSLIYLNTAVLKCNGSTWLGGTALHFVLNNAEVRRFDFTWLCQYPLILNALTQGALFLEFALAFLLWSRATRPWIACAGLALHAGILPMINVPLFGEMMTAAYLTFLSPEEFDKLLHSLDFRRLFPARRQAAAVLPGRFDEPHPAHHGPHAPVEADPTVRASH